MKDSNMREVRARRKARAAKRDRDRTVRMLAGQRRRRYGPLYENAGLILFLILAAIAVAAVPIAFTFPQ